MFETPNHDSSLPLARFECDVTYVGECAVVLPRGDLDLATAPTLLRDALATLALPVRAIALDLRYVSFMDSSAIKVLVDARNQAVERGLEFTLLSVPPQPRTVLEVTGLAETFGLLPRSDGP